MTVFGILFWSFIVCLTFKILAEKAWIALRKRAAKKRAIKAAKKRAKIRRKLAKQAEKRARRAAFWASLNPFKKSRPVQAVPSTPRKVRKNGYCELRSAVK